MKRVVMTALAMTLLCGTSALAQGGAVASRRAQLESEARARSESSRPAPAPRAEAPRSEPQRDRSAGSDGRSRGDGRGPDRAQPALAGAAPAQQPVARPQRVEGQRPQEGQGQRQRDPRTQSTEGPQGQWRQGGGVSQWQGQRGTTGRPEQGVRPDTRPSQGQTRPDSQYDRNDRDRTGGRDDDRRGGYNNGGSGWNNDRGQQGRPPIIRREDRRDRDWNRPNYDQRRYPRYVTPQQRYRWRGSIYRPPVGFYSYRWQFGQTLPWNWYTPNYYLNDWWSYGLPMPPAGYEWVRLGDDAALIDVFSGRIYQVVYNLFW